MAPRTQQIKSAANTIALPLVAVLGIVGGYLFDRIETHEREYADLVRTVALLQADVSALKSARAEASRAESIALEVLRALEKESTP